MRKRKVNTVKIPVKFQDTNIGISEKIRIYLEKHGSNPYSNIPRELPVCALAKMWGVRPSAITNAVNRMAEKGIVRRIKPAQRSKTVELVLLKPYRPKERTTTKLVRFYAYEVVYWYARLFPGEVNLHRFAKVTKIDERTLLFVIKKLQKDKVITFRKIGKTWNGVLLQPLRPYTSDYDYYCNPTWAKRIASTANAQELPEEFVRWLRNVRAYVNKPDSNPPHTPPSKDIYNNNNNLTTQSTNKGISIVKGGEKKSGSALDDRWKLEKELDETLWRLLWSYRMIDPFGELPSKPWENRNSGAIMPHPQAAAKIRRMIGMAGNDGEFAVKLMKKSTHVVSTMPSQANSQYKTLYRVGTAKLRTLLKAFQSRIPDYSVNSEDNEIVRSMKVGWLCDAWVDAFTAGEEYDPYELPFDETADNRFVRWRRGLEWIINNDGVWETFWAMVARYAVSRGIVEPIDWRRISVWVYMGGDELAEIAGSYDSPTRELAVANQLARWLVAKDKKENEFTRTEEEEVTLRTIMILNKIMDKPMEHPEIRSVVLRALSAITCRGWGLSEKVLGYLGITGNIEELRAEAFEHYVAFLVENGAEEEEARRETKLMFAQNSRVSKDVDFNLDLSPGEQLNEVQVLPCTPFYPQYYDVLLQGDINAEERSIIERKKAILEKGEITWEDCQVLATETNIELLMYGEVPDAFAFARAFINSDAVYSG